MFFFAKPDNMKFNTPLVAGKLIKRYKRFLTDVELEDGSIVTAHCTNSGSMKSCIEPGANVYLSPVNDPKRKTKFTWEMIEINDNWVGINTSNPNTLAFEAIKGGLIEKLRGYTTVKREVKYGDSRFDVYAENEKEKCFIEVKNVTWKEGNYALFPDAVTSRGLKHLKTLQKVKTEGYRAVMLYIIQRCDVKYFDAAHDLDPDYSNELYTAYENGVEVIPIMAHVTPQDITIGEVIPWINQKSRH